MNFPNALFQRLSGTWQVISSEQDLITPQLAYEFKVAWESFDTSQEFLDSQDLDEFIVMVRTNIEWLLSGLCLVGSGNMMNG